MAKAKRSNMIYMFSIGDRAYYKYIIKKNYVKFYSYRVKEMSNALSDKRAENNHDIVMIILNNIYSIKFKEELRKNDSQKSKIFGSFLI